MVISAIFLRKLFSYKCQCSFLSTLYITIRGKIWNNNVITCLCLCFQDKLSNQISRLEKKVKQQIIINQELLEGLNENKRRKSNIQS